MKLYRIIQITGLVKNSNIQHSVSLVQQKIEYFLQFDRSVVVLKEQFKFKVLKGCSHY